MSTVLSAVHTHTCKTHPCQPLCHNVLEQHSCRSCSWYLPGCVVASLNAMVQELLADFLQLASLTSAGLELSVSDQILLHCFGMVQTQ